jgi:hypothetical protein
MKSYRGCCKGKPSNLVTIVLALVKYFLEVLRKRLGDKLGTERSACILPDDQDLNMLEREYDSHLHPDPYTRSTCVTRLQQHARHV